eukprot:4911245-Amphidinium_carterae.1
MPTQVAAIQENIMQQFLNTANEQQNRIVTLETMARNEFQVLFDTQQKQMAELETTAREVRYAGRGRPCQ